VEISCEGSTAASPILIHNPTRLVLQGPKSVGLMFIPPGEVEVIREEHAGRLEVVLCSGEVCHLSRQLEEVEQALMATSEEMASPSWAVLSR